MKNFLKYSLARLKSPYNFFKENSKKLDFKYFLLSKSFFNKSFQSSGRTFLNLKKLFFRKRLSKITSYIFRWAAPRATLIKFFKIKGLFYRRKKLKQKIRTRQ